MTRQRRIRAEDVEEADDGRDRSARMRASSKERAARKEKLFPLS
jgi:hypothetical protein